MKKKKCNLEEGPNNKKKIDETNGKTCTHLQNHNCNVEYNALYFAYEHEGSKVKLLLEWEIIYLYTLFFSFIVS